MLLLAFSNMITVLLSMISFGTMTAFGVDQNNNKNHPTHNKQKVASTMVKCDENRYHNANTVADPVSPLREIKHVIIFIHCQTITNVPVLSSIR